MYSTYVLLQADSACKNVHDLVHDVVPQKICSCREHIFSDHLSLLKRSVRRPFFFFLVGLAVVRRPADTFHVELVRASAHVSCTREILRLRA